MGTALNGVAENKYHNLTINIENKFTKFPNGAKTGSWGSGE
jgi:hypothetical protein